MFDKISDFFSRGAPAGRSIVQSCRSAHERHASVRPGHPATDPDTWDDGTLVPAQVTTRDFALLESIARLRLGPENPIRSRMLEKLDECMVVPSEEIAPDIVTLDARVTFDVDGATPITRTLVRPTGMADAESISVLTPVGLALLGQRAGTRTTVDHWDGRRCAIRIHTVPFQPEAHARG